MGTRGKVLLSAGLAGVVVLAVALALFQPWRVYTQRTVDEAVPAVAAPRASEPAPAAPSASAAPASPVEEARGAFVSHAHETRGTARLLRLPDGARVLRLEGFSTSDGPDVKIWLTDAPASGDGDRVDDGRYLDLGTLKGTDGNQNYAVPAGSDLGGLSTVAVWCDRFDVSFGVAALA